MDVKQLADLVRFSPEALQKVNVHASANLRVNLLCLGPGQSEAAHTHEGTDKVYYVMSGSATVTVGNESRQVGPGDAVLAPPDISHGVINDGEERFTALVVVAPNPHP